MSDNTVVSMDEAEKMFAESYTAISKGEALPALEAAAPTPDPTPEPTQVPVEEKKEEEAAPPEPAQPEPEKNGEEKKPEPAPAKPDPYDWLKDVPESLRDKVQAEINARAQLEHRVKSDDGRVRGMQEKLLAAQRKLSQITTSPTASKPPAPADQPSTPEGWKEIIKSDPELAKAIEGMVQARVEAAVRPVEDKFQELHKTAIDPLYERQQQQYAENQWNELTRMVPNVQEVVTSEAYSNWLEKHASPGIRYLATTSLEATDAIAVLQAYANDMINLGYAKRPDPPAPATQPVDTSAADKIEAERKAKLAATTPTSGPPIAPVPGKGNGPLTVDDAQKILEEEYRKLMKK